jgi:hypothetical protein
MSFVSPLAQLSIVELTVSVLYRYVRGVSPCPQLTHVHVVTYHPNNYYDPPVQYYGIAFAINIAITAIVQTAA